MGTGCDFLGSDHRDRRVRQIGLDDREPLFHHRLAILVSDRVSTEAHEQRLTARDQPFAEDLVSVDLGYIEDHFPDTLVLTRGPTRPGTTLAIRCMFPRAHDRVGDRHQSSGWLDGSTRLNRAAVRAGTGVLSGTIHRHVVDRFDNGILKDDLHKNSLIELRPTMVVCQPTRTFSGFGSLTEFLAVPRGLHHDRAIAPAMDHRRGATRCSNLRGLKDLRNGAFQDTADQFLSRIARVVQTVAAP